MYSRDVISVAFTSAVSVCDVWPLRAMSACTTTASVLGDASDDGDNVVPAASGTSDNGVGENKMSFMLACVDVVDVKEN